MTDIWQIAQSTISGNTAAKITDQGNGDAMAIIAAIERVWPDSVKQSAKFAKRLRQIYGTDNDRLLRDLYETVCRRVRLQYDPFGVQYVRKPANVVRDGECDCKSYALFLSSVLTNLQIPHLFRFVAWHPGAEVSHVYIVAFPDGKRTVLDCNLKKYGLEKLPNYNSIEIDMTKIYSMGALPPATLLDGRDVSQMSGLELGLRGKREELRAERDHLHGICGNDDARANYDAAIDMTTDLINTVGAITDNPNRWVKSANNMIGAIQYDWATGRYHKYPIDELHSMRAAEWNAGVRHHAVGSFWSSVKKVTKKVGNVAKSGVKIVASTTKKTVKGVANVTKGVTRVAANTVKAATIAPAALFSSKARQELKDAQSRMKQGAKEFGEGNKQIVTAAGSATLETILEDYMPKAGYYFLYMFIPDADVSSYPAKVQKKRAKQKRMWNFLVKWLGVDEDKLKSISRSGIIKHTGKTPEELIAAYAKGKKISGVGEVVAIITICISAINAIANFIKSWKGKSSSETAKEEDVAGSGDGDSDSDSDSASTTTSGSSTELDEKLNTLTTQANQYNNLIKDGYNVYAGLTNKESAKADSTTATTSTDTTTPATTASDTNAVISPAATTTTKKTSYLPWLIGGGVLAAVLLTRKKGKRK